MGKPESITAALLTCDVVIHGDQGGEAARQVRNAPQPKFWAGPAHRSGAAAQAQAQEAFALESPLLVRCSVSLYAHSPCSSPRMQRQLVTLHKPASAVKGAAHLAQLAR